MSELRIENRSERGLPVPLGIHWNITKMRNLETGDTKCGLGGGQLMRITPWNLVLLEFRNHTHLILITWYSETRIFWFSFPGIQETDSFDSHYLEFRDQNILILISWNSGNRLLILITWNSETRLIWFSLPGIQRPEYFDSRFLEFRDQDLLILISWNSETRLIWFSLPGIQRPDSWFSFPGIQTPDSS